MPVLVSIPYSPWSQRAADALIYMGVPHRVRPYQPVVSEPRLRFALRRPLGRFSLPVLLHDEGPPLMDSFEIARWGAHRCHPDVSPLVTDANADDVAALCALADAVGEVGRIRTATRVLASPKALQEALPPSVRLLGPLGMAIGRDAARRLVRKYPDGHDDTDRLDAMTVALDRIEAARAGAPTLLDQRSYADIAVAWALCFVRPVARQGLGPATRPCWTEVTLETRFAALLAWRDDVLAWSAQGPEA